MHNGVGLIQTWSANIISVIMCQDEETYILVFTRIGPVLSGREISS